MGGSESSTVCKFLHIEKQCKLMRPVKFFEEFFLRVFLEELKLVQNKAYTVQLEGAA